MLAMLVNLAKKKINFLSHCKIEKYSMRCNNYEHSTRQVRTEFKQDINIRLDKFKQETNARLDKFEQRMDRMETKWMM